MKYELAKVFVPLEETLFHWELEPNIDSENDCVQISENEWAIPFIYEIAFNRDAFLDTSWKAYLA